MTISKIQSRLGRAVPLLCAVLALVSLIFCSADAMDSARAGLELCARVIVPSLFPFFVISSLLFELGLPHYLGRLAAPLMSRLFNVSGDGAAVFILGLCGGYPLGARAAAEMYKNKQCGKDEAERLIAFCNNCGPSFIIGAAGVGIFNKPSIGLLLYAVHVIAAALLGVLISGGPGKAAETKRTGTLFQSVSFGEALSGSVKAAVSSIVTVSGFIVFFSVIAGILDSLGVFIAASARLSLSTGIGLDQARSLLTGILEIGSGIGSMSGFPATAGNLALCSFILGWGGLSVQCQTLAVAAPLGLSVKRHFAGRLISGLVSALLTLAACFVLQF